MSTDVRECEEIFSRFKNVKLILINGDEDESKSIAERIDELDCAQFEMSMKVIERIASQVSTALTESLF
jgi:phosphate uptake regulator